MPNLKFGNDLVVLKKAHAKINKKLNGNHSIKNCAELGGFEYFSLFCHTDSES